MKSVLFAPLLIYISIYAMAMVMVHNYFIEKIYPHGNNCDYLIIRRVNNACLDKSCLLI